MLRSTALTEDSLRNQMMIEFGEAGAEIVDKMRQKWEKEEALGKRSWFFGRVGDFGRRTKNTLATAASKTAELV